MANECFERELKRSLSEYPEFHYFDSKIFKDCFLKSQIQVYDGIKDHDFLLEFNDSGEIKHMNIDLYGYPEAGHCAYYPIKGYDFMLDGTDENLWKNVLPARRKELANEEYPTLEVFSLADLNSQISRIWDGLSYFYSETEMMNEYFNILKSPGTLYCNPSHNRIVKMFQPHLFDNQNLVYQNPYERRKLIQNRMKFKFKLEHEITTVDLIVGCRISGACQTFSYFSPLWFKYFIGKYQVKKVYDPFGGWGHRMLGSHNLDLYIYNDLSGKTYNGTKAISEFLSLKNVELHNCDAAEFKPESDFDAVFTCPPYDNLEEYEFPVSDFKALMRNALNCGSKLYGIVILEKYEPLLNIKELIEKSAINTSKSHFGKENLEFLYVYKS